MIRSAQPLDGLTSMFPVTKKPSSIGAPMAASTAVSVWAVYSAWP